jgi:hypothetical protein
MRTKIFQKCIDIIKSCETISQLRVAKKYVHYSDKYLENEYYNHLINLILDKTEELIIK